MNQKQYEYQRKMRACEKLKITAGQFSYIKRVGSTLRQLYENSCNGFLTFDGTEDVRRARLNDKKAERYERNAAKFAKDNGLYLYLQTDPRGATIYLDINPIPENNYTQATCIY